MRNISATISFIKKREVTKEAWVTKEVQQRSCSGALWLSITINTNELKCGKLSNACFKQLR